MSGTQYSVVRFVQSDTVGVVPTKWLTREESKLLTYWPSGTKISVTRMIMQYDDHSPTWKKYEVAKLHEYSSYNKANRACVVAENKTDIDTAAGDSDVESGKRKRSRPLRFASDDEAEQEPTNRSKIVQSSDEDDNEKKIDDVRDRVKQLLSVNSKKGHSKVQSSNFKSNVKSKVQKDKSKKSKRPPSNTKTAPAAGCSSITPPLSPDPSSTSMQPGSPVIVPQQKHPNNELNITPVAIGLVAKAHSAIQSEREVYQNPVLDLSGAKDNGHARNSTFLDESGACSSFVSDDINNLDDNNNGLYEEEENVIPAKSCTSTKFMDQFPTKKSSTEKHFLVPESPEAGGNFKSLGTRSVAVSSLDKSDQLMIKALLWQYEEISSKLDFITARIELLQRSINPDEELLSRPTGAPSFPLFNEESLKELEKYLESDVNFKLTLGYLQAHIDGVDEPSKATKVLLKKVITNRLARILSYSGTGGSKINFSETRLLECIFCAIKTVFKQDACLEKVKINVQRWLCTANQRVLEPLPPKKD